ncbi:MAG: hypothetical protein WDN69_10960 [Aliidongia sp.]
MRRDEVEAAWSWVEPILDGWSRTGQGVQALYLRDLGPLRGDRALIERDGRTWHDDPM